MTCRQITLEIKGALATLEGQCLGNRYWLECVKGI